MAVESAFLDLTQDVRASAAGMANVPIFAAAVVPTTLADRFDPARRFERRHERTNRDALRLRATRTERDLEWLLKQITTASGGAVLKADSREQAYDRLLEGGWTVKRAGG